MMRSNSQSPLKYSGILGVLICFTWAMAAISMRAQYIAPKPESAEGVISSLSYERNVAVIDGLSYYITTDALVEIRGTYGAFTMLEKGMKVSFSFYRINDFRREITRLVQLSDNQRMDEH